MAELTNTPLTIIYDDAKNLAENLIAADGSVGIRITSEAFSQQLCARFKKPIVSTSANLAGTPFPRNYSEISEEIKQGVDYVVSYRQDDPQNGTPSGIIKIGKGGTVKIIRE